MRNTLLKPLLRQLHSTLAFRWPLALAVTGLALLSQGEAQAQTTVTTIGGGSTSSPYYGYADGSTLHASKFYAPAGMALDPSGSTLYIADCSNNMVRVVSSAGNTGSSVTTTLANATNSGTIGVSHPLAVAVDAATNVYVLNHGTGANGAVLHLGGIGGSLTVYPVLASNLVNVTAMTMDGVGNLYVTMNANKVIRVTTNKVMTTLGTISAVGTSLQGITMLDNGQLALTDAGNNGIWTMNPLNGTSAKFTGFHGAADVLGSASIAAFNTPETISKAGNGVLVVADKGNNKVKLVDNTGTVTLLYGVNSNLWLTGTGKFPGWADGAGTATQGSAESRQPYGVAVSPDGSVYVAEDYYHVLRHVTGTGLVAPQPSYPQVFNGPSGIAYDSTDNYLFIANNTNSSVQQLNLNNNVTTTFLDSSDGVTNPASVLVDTNDNIYVLNQGPTGNGYVLEFDIYGNAYGPIITGLNQPTAFTLDSYGNFIITEQSGNIRAFGADFTNTLATITNAHVSLQGVALFDDGTIAVSDAGNHVIWTVNPITKLISKLTGQLGTNGISVGASNFAKLYQPHQLARLAGNQLLAADFGNNRLVQIARNGTVTTNHVNLSPGTTLWFGNSGDPIPYGNSKYVNIVAPFGVAVGSGGEIFDSETFYADIRGQTGTTLNAPSFNPEVPIPVYSNPAGIALDTTGTLLFVADPTNDTVSILDLANNQTSVFLDSSSGIYQPVDVGVDIEDNLYVLNQGTGGNGSIMEFDTYGNFIGTTVASLPMPTAMKLDFVGDFYVTELNGLVQMFNSSGSNTLANITTNANVKLQGIAVLDNGAVVVSDSGNQVIWQIPSGSNNAVLLTGVLGTPGSNFGTVGFAKLNKPMRLAQANGGLLLIADSGNNRVVVANDAGSISSALNSTNADIWFGLPIDPVTSSSPSFVPMQSPVGLAIGAGGTVYASESLYKDIRGLLGTGIAAPTPPPAAPLNLVANASYGQVALSWSASIGATNYFVKRATSTNSVFTVVASTPGTSFVDTSVLSGTTYYYEVSASNSGGQSPNSAIVSAKPLIPPPPAPRIGWFDYGNNPAILSSTLHPVSVATFNNDQKLAIDPVKTGISTYYIQGIPPLNGSPSATNGNSPPFYQDNLSYVQSLTVPSAPDVIMEAINIDSQGQASPITTAEFLFQVGNPTVNGFNGAQFTVSDITTNSVFWYTLDGSDPTNASPSIGPISLGGTNSATLSIVVTSNVLFKARAYRSGYTPSGVAVQSFSPGNFSANTISFGFGSGEASSDFVAAPGQTFYAPVTLGILPNTTMYSLQFNVVVTNAGPNPGSAISPGAFGFESMLVKPDTVQGLYDVIPPYMFVGDDTGPLNPSQIVTYGGTNFVNLETANTALNLLAVGWLERYTETNLFPTTSQDLIQYSLAHDDLFSQSGGQIILGGYAFQVPANASNGQTYQIQINRPSATSDGIGAPGSDVYIAAPTNGATAGGSPVNALKYVTVGQRKYIAGSVYPFRWFNAGDFGSSNIVSADVLQVFQSAIYLLNMPPQGSDFYDAMDSSGSYGAVDNNGADANYGYYTNANSVLAEPGQTSPLFSGDDTTINQVAFGDGALDVCDVYVTYRRSLDPSLTWFRRFWNNGQLVADTNAPNVASHALKAPTKTTTVAPKSLNLTSTPPQVNFSAGDVIGQAGQKVQVPINATILGNYPLRLLMLNLTVVPLDGSPALTTPVAFSQTASTIGAPLTTMSQGNNNFAAVWLSSTNSGLTGTVTLGTLSITIPPGASSKAAYAIHFDHASASPNGLASFPNQKLTGVLTTSAQTNSTYGDGIPDSWRLRWFGTVNNVLSASNACPSGDGIPNWKKFVAGVDPNVANDFPSVKSKFPVPSGSTTAIHWPSVSGKQYVIQRSSNVFNGPWTIISTNTGTGGDMEYDDSSTANAKFYRVQILP